jgi:uncharacterized damage-inducible protein DinB
MPDLANVVSASLGNYYEFVAAQLHKWVDPLPEEQLWRNPHGYGNSIGHLVLHLTGNLNYYVGARIAGAGYVRNRDREFTQPEHPEKKQILGEFDRAMTMVLDTIRKQSPSDWAAAYSAERETEAKDRFTVLLRCAGHAYHHVGQIIYLSKELAPGTRPGTAGP